MISIFCDLTVNVVRPTPILRPQATSTKIHYQWYRLQLLSKPISQTKLKLTQTTLTNLTNRNSQSQSPNTPNNALTQNRQKFKLLVEETHSMFFSKFSPLPMWEEPWANAIKPFATMPIYKGPILFLDG